MKKLTKIIVSLNILIILTGLSIPMAQAQSLSAADEAARNKYQNAWQLYQKEVNFYKSARQDFLTARDNFQKARNAENRKALEDAARTFLEKAVSSLIQRLEVIKTWVSNRGALSEEERQAIIAEIDQDINWLTERQTKIQTASWDQIKEEALTLKNYWATHRAKVKRIIGQIWVYRVNFIISKAEGFATRVQEGINKLQAQGQDTAQLEGWLDNYNQKLDLARDKVAAAKQQFLAISNLKEADQLFQSGNQFIQEANKYLKEAYTQLVEIVREMKTMGTTT